MQEEEASVLEALPPVTTPHSLPTSVATPEEDAATVVTNSNAVQAMTSDQGQPVTCPVIGQAAQSTMPPPNPQGASITPTSAAAEAGSSFSQQDPIYGYLLNDAAFVAAVKKQDTVQAAQAAAKVIKSNLHAIMARIKPQQATAMATLLPSGPQPHPGAAAVGSVPGAMPVYSPMGAPGMPMGMPPGERRLSDPDGRYRRGGSCEPGGGDPAGGQPRVRELRRGDWVVIRSANKSTDPELLGHDAWVARVEHNGWVELQVPKLGRTVKLQQRYLQLIQPQHPMIMMGGPPAAMLGPPPTPTGAAAAIMPQPQAAAAAMTQQHLQQPQQQQAVGMMSIPILPRRTASEAGGGGGAMAPPGTTYLDEQGRPYKRLQMDPSVRPALPLEALPPARVAATPGRSNIARVRDILRAIRRELLAIEESVPWNCVSATWKNVRPGWRRSLQRNIDASPAPSAPPSVAGQGPAGAQPVPSTAATAAADDAAAAAVAALVGATAASMLELHDALTTEKGYGLFARRGAWETRLRELADGGNNHACLQALWSEMAEGIRVWMAAPPGTPGAAPAEGQTPRELYATPFPGSEDYFMAPPAAAPGMVPPHPAAAAMAPSPFFDFASVGGRGGAAAAAAGAGGVGRVPVGPVPGVAPWVVRSDLALLMQAIESEVDTDLDEGPEATDVEDDSDAELAARRRRRRQRPQQQTAEPAQPAAAGNGVTGAPPPVPLPEGMTTASPGGGDEAAAATAAVSPEGTEPAAEGPEAMDVDRGTDPPEGTLAGPISPVEDSAPGAVPAGMDAENVCGDDSGSPGTAPAIQLTAAPAEAVEGKAEPPAAADAPAGDPQAAADTTPAGASDLTVPAADPCANSGAPGPAGIASEGPCPDVGPVPQEDTPMTG